MTTPINQLREMMRREHLGAVIIPSTDAHQSEYVPDYWKGREWLTGFDGSAGTVVVTMDAAALWTDSRYFIAAASQLQGSGVELMRQGVEGTPSVAQWIGRQLERADSTEVAIDGMVVSENEARQLIEALRRNGGLTLRTSMDPLRNVWRDRPAMPGSKARIQPLDYAGETAASKLSRVRQAIRRQHADGLLVSALDDIAWTLNLRGADVHCNPVLVSYLLISSTRATLFVSPDKLTSEVKAYLSDQGVDTDDYRNIRQGLRDYFEFNILLDPDETSHTLFHTVTREVVRGENPIAAMKAVKNREEQLGFRRAMLRDGIAMTQFLCWIDKAMASSSRAEGGTGEPLTELSVSRKLRQLRQSQPLFRDISFDTIAAYGPHAAIVHYEPTEATDATLEPHGLLLVDSGAQYQDGTTDITRTVALGPLTPEERKVYTLVLRGHIRLQMLRFPDGASGTQLDAIAREPLWQHGLNFRHGTGHGVGSYLNVHEGPHQIRMEWRPAPLRQGMTVTDEPGIYLENRFGVRIENTLLVVADRHTEMGLFNRFETLTLCPIDLRPVVGDLLKDDERQWLDDYHAEVRRLIMPHLSDPDERQWLEENTLTCSERGL